MDVLLVIAFAGFFMLVAGGSLSGNRSISNSFYSVQPTDAALATRIFGYLPNNALEIFI